MAEHDYAAQARMASALNVLLGIWLIVSPWVFGYSAAGGAAIWNSVVAGALIVILGANRVSSPHTGSGLSWTNLLLGLWTIASPWIYVYDRQSSAVWDNVVLGVVVAALAVWSGSATAVEHRHHGPIQQT